jgi:heptosyltransferase III
MVSLPCFHLVARCFPDAERVLLNDYPASPKAARAGTVLDGSGLIHRSFGFTKRPPDLRDILQVARRIRRFNPDQMVYVAPLKSTRFVWQDWLYFRFVCGIRHIIGLSEAFDQVRRFDEVTGLYEHEASRLARLITKLGDAQPHKLENWDLCLSEVERENAQKALGELAQSPVIVWGPGTNQAAKDWGQENWRELFKRLGQDFSKYALVMIGAKEDAAAGDFASASWLGPKINLCGSLTPRESLAVIELASLFLGPDSGPMHLAASVRVPCVAPFGARSHPGVWFPIGDQHQVIYHKADSFGRISEACIVENRCCLSSITVDEVYDRVLRVLQPSGV